MKLQIATLASLFALFCCVPASADETVAKPSAEVDVFGVGNIVVPAEFKVAPRKSRIIEHEFAVTEGDADDAPSARLTMMRSGGGVEAHKRLVTVPIQTVLILRLGVMTVMTV
jgi:hypothetical protein